MPKHARGQQPLVPSAGVPELTAVCSFWQINNYLTVPAHKLDSPTMSRARIGSGKAGPRVPGEGPGGWALRASQSQRGGQASPSLTSQVLSSSYIRQRWGWACCPPRGQVLHVG